VAKDGTLREIGVTLFKVVNFSPRILMGWLRFPLALQRLFAVCATLETIIKEFCLTLYFWLQFS
jgi:hypothetical protein